jgi:fumarylpyruvate hydrolase
MSGCSDDASEFAVPLARRTTIPVVGGGLFPVRRIYTIGRNYRTHTAAAPGRSDITTAPRISLKPTDSVVAGGGAVAYPPATRQLEPEIELVLAIGRGAADVSRAAALGHVFGYCVGLDMIRRDVLNACVERRESWDLSKSFSGASPVSAMMPAARSGHPSAGSIWLEINGERVLGGDLSEQLWDSAEVIARLSQFDRIEPGDLIFTGTPGRAPTVSRNDVLHGHIDAVGDLRVIIM